MKPSASAATAISLAALLTVGLTSAMPAAAIPGAITEHGPIAPYSYPLWITDGPDGALWFTELEADKIGRMNTFGELIEYPIPGENQDPVGIVTGSDGALWFTIDSERNAIGRLTTSGHFKRFALPGDHDPLLITAGPGGMWFSETDTFGRKSWIGRISMAGHITHFRVDGKRGSAPMGLVEGPDGNIWWADLGGYIGRLTPEGIRRFPVAPETKPSGIAVGPDGALWFTMRQSSQIGRITIDGDITTFPLPTPKSHPFGIAAGPDGALWFTEVSGNAIGRITTAGVVTEYPIATNRTKPFGIAEGSDGQMWFAGFNKGIIGSVETT